MTEKFADFFDPNKISGPIHIVGCGAIGSTLALMLARCGARDLILWDFDTVVPHNLANQQYFLKQVGQLKTTALKSLIHAINPAINVIEMGKWNGEFLGGYVMMAVDNIDIRKEIINNSLGAHLIMDYRMRVADAQHYAANPVIPKDIIRLRESMAFTQEEADAATPVNGCGLSESIMPTVAMIVALGVANFINYLNEQELQHTIVSAPFTQIVY
jgi:sulfur carrier protein ThiS adenylyltransferase